MVRSSSVSTGDTKRAAVVDAAARLVRERRDVEAVGVDEVAALARVSKATLYRYFPSKAALIEAVAEREGVDPAQWSVPDRRTQILEAAMALIPQRGLRAMTMEQIAEAAGISPATIYWHFASKEALIVEVANHCSPLEVFRRNLGPGASGDPHDDLRRLVREMLAHAAGRFDVVMTCVHESWASPRVAAHFVRTIALPAWSVIGAYFDAQVEAGRLKPAPFLPRLLSLAGPVWAYLTARRALSGVMAHAALAEEPPGAPRGRGRRTSASRAARSASGFNPLSLMLSLAGAAPASHAASELDPEQMVDTHVDTFLAGNATPAYLAELRRRHAKDDAVKRMDRTDRANKKEATA